MELVSSDVAGPRGLAVIRGDSVALVSSLDGLREVGLDGSAVSRVVVERWPGDPARPSSLGVDERGSGVLGRAKGLAVVYAADEDSGRVFSVDVGSDDVVADTRVAIEVDG